MYYYIVSKKKRQKINVNSTLNNEIQIQFSQKKMNIHNHEFGTYVKSVLFIKRFFNLEII